MKLLHLLSILCAFLSLSSPVSAGVTTVQELYFGHYLILGNKAQGDVVVNTNGSHSFDPAVYVEIDAPRVGIYVVDELPANMAVSTVTITATNMLNAGLAFQTRDWQTLFPPQTNASGELTVTVGGTLRSSGNTVQYPDGTYLASLQITVNF